MGQQYSNSPRAKDFLPLVLTILKSSTGRNKFKAFLALEWHYEKWIFTSNLWNQRVRVVPYLHYFPLDAGWNVETPSCTILKLIFWKIPDRIIVSQTWDKKQVWISEIKKRSWLQEFNFDVKRCNLKWLTFKLHVSSISSQCKVNFLISAEQHRSNVLEPKQSLPRPWQLHCTCAKYGRRRGGSHVSKCKNGRSREIAPGTLHNEQDCCNWKHPAKSTSGDLCYVEGSWAKQMWWKWMTTEGISKKWDLWDLSSCQEPTFQPLKHIFDCLHRSDMRCSNAGVCCSKRKPKCSQKKSHGLGFVDKTQFEGVLSIRFVHAAKCQDLVSPEMEELKGQTKISTFGILRATCTRVMP